MKICECECHKDTTGILNEFFPCCGSANKKYINSDGKIDEERLPKEKPKIKRKRKKK